VCGRSFSVISVEPEVSYILREMLLVGSNVWGDQPQIPSRLCGPIALRSLLHLAGHGCTMSKKFFFCFILFKRSSSMYSRPNRAGVTIPAMLAEDTMLPLV
jgi:hypothetical protein